MPNPLFLSTSTEKPDLLTISFEDDPQGSLGAQLINCDKVSVCNWGHREHVPENLLFHLTHEHSVFLFSQHEGGTIWNVFSRICSNWPITGRWNSRAQIWSEGWRRNRGCQWFWVSSVCIGFWRQWGDKSIKGFIHPKRQQCIAPWEGRGLWCTFDKNQDHQIGRKSSVSFEFRKVCFVFIRLALLLFSWCITCKRYFFRSPYHTCKIYREVNHFFHLSHRFLSSKLLFLAVDMLGTPKSILGRVF